MISPAADTPTPILVRRQNRQCLPRETLAGRRLGFFFGGFCALILLPFSKAEFSPPRPAEPAWVRSLGRARTFMRGHGLRVLQRAAIAEIGGDAGRTEGVRNAGSLGAFGCGAALEKEFGSR